MKSLITIFLSFITLFASAQISTNSKWTWMKGDSSINQSGVYGIKGIPSPFNKPGNRNSATTWTDKNGNLWLFGGSDNVRVTFMNDLWKYDPTANQWTWISGDSIATLGIYGVKGISNSNNKPGFRIRAVSWTDTTGNLWLFGGKGEAATTGGYLNDLWKYNISTNQWTWVSGDSITNQHSIYGVRLISSPTNKPGGRELGKSAIDSFGNLLLFAGSGYTNPNFGDLNDLWKYTPSTNQWTWISGDSITNQLGIYGSQGVSAPLNKPGSRWGSNLWTDRIGNLWLFGGYHPGVATFNDLWKYDFTNNQWTWMKGSNASSQSGTYGTLGIPDPANTPGARYLGGSWGDKSGNFWVFGGGGYPSSGAGGVLNDLWKYNPTSNEWAWIKGDSTINSLGVYGTEGIASTANSIGARDDFMLWEDLSGNCWIMGGAGYSTTGVGTFNDLWKLSNDDTVHLCPPFGSTSFTSNLSGATYQWQLSQDKGLSYANLVNGSNYSGVNTLTLTLNNIPSSSYGYQYRCLVDGNYGGIYTIKCVNTWTGAVSSAWENPANWSCGTLPDGFTDVIINAGAVVIINSNVSIATLSLNPGASLTITPPHTITLLGH